MQGLKMVRSKKFNEGLEEFLQKYHVTHPDHMNEEYRTAVEMICTELSQMEIKFDHLNSEAQMTAILNNVQKIMLQFHNADIQEPLNYINFNLYMKFSQIITKLKSLILSEMLLDGNIIFDGRHLLNSEVEQYICDNYKLKFQEFKAIHSEKELQTINENFTSFLLEFVNTPSSLIKKNALQRKKNVKLILDVADVNVMMHNIHNVSYITLTQKKIIFEKIASFCINEDIVVNDLYKCELINSDFDRKLELCIMSYFVFQDICKDLDLLKLHQTSKILSMIILNDIKLIKLNTINSKFEQYCVTSSKHFDCKTHNKMKTITSSKIVKCLNILHVILDALCYYNNSIYNYPFTVVLYSMLQEFAMWTDLNETGINYLLDLAEGYTNLCALPNNFPLASYLSNIYPRMKYSEPLEIKFISFCRTACSGISYQDQDFIKDLESVINDEDNWIDKSVVLSHILNYTTEINITEDQTLYNLLCTYNEHVVHLSHQYTSSKLILPYSVSLHFSLLYKNEDCLFNNLAILNKYLAILFENDKEWSYDGSKLLQIVFQYYEDIVTCLPDNFLIEYWKGSMIHDNINTKLASKLLKLCSSKDLITLIEMLKIKTIEIIEGYETNFEENTNFVNNFNFEFVWDVLLKMEFVNQKKKIRKDHINHFCFTLNKTFLFSTDKLQTDAGLSLLITLITKLMKLSWVNQSMLMNCSLRIITFVEKVCVTNIAVLTNAAELLIVLYKCPNLIKPVLGLYITSFVCLFKKSWSFVLSMIENDKVATYNHNYIAIFHKLEKCSSLFKENKSDFDIICRYIIDDLIKLISLREHLPKNCMRHCYNIVFNFMELCSPMDMEQITLNIQGPALSTLIDTYREYRSNIRFDGRL